MLIKSGLLLTEGSSTPVMNSSHSYREIVMAVNADTAALMLLCSYGVLAESR